MTTIIIIFVIASIMASALVVSVSMLSSRISRSQFEEYEYEVVEKPLKSEIPETAPHPRVAPHSSI